jgi:hypothetical protein
MTYVEAPYPCPCCGSLVFEEPPGSSYICPVCQWEDDGPGLRWVLRNAGGPNDLSLYDSQKRFEKSGIEPRNRDASWHAFQLHVDYAERFEGGEAGHTYPADSTTLYYWSDNYWLRDDPSRRIP